MQTAYITALYELMKTDARVCSLLSDSGTDYDEMMAAEFPAQCFNFGIAEQNKVAAAAGMASCGKIPFVYTSGAFLAYRSYEFIRDDVCLQNQNVKLVGMGSGTSWRTLGPSHHTSEDLAALRALPRLTIFSPATPLEAAASVKWAYETSGPVYIRLGMSGESEYFQAEDILAPHIYPVITQGTDIAMFVTGSILCEAVRAAELLAQRGLSMAVIDVRTIKHLNSESILDYASSYENVCTLEEHSLFGGLGGAIAEILAESDLRVKYKRFGLKDCFAKGYGTQQQVRQQNGLDAESIAGAVMNWLEG